jgi:hypothetical protein
MKKIINKRQSVKKSCIKRNILQFFLILVLVNVFGACEKEETRFSEVRIVKTSITEIGFTSADFTILLDNYPWWLYAIGIGISSYNDQTDVKFLWDDIESYWDEDMDMRLYKQIVHIEGLESGTHYGCHASILVDGLTVSSEIEYFTTDSE